MHTQYTPLIYTILELLLQQSRPTYAIQIGTFQQQHVQINWKMKIICQNNEMKWCNDKNKINNIVTTTKPCSRQQRHSQLLSRTQPLLNLNICSHITIQLQSHHHPYRDTLNIDVSVVLAHQHASDVDTAMRASHHKSRGSTLTT